MSPAKPATSDVAPDGTVSDAVATPVAFVVVDPVDDPRVKVTVFPFNPTQALPDLFWRVAEAVIVAPHAPVVGLMSLV